jgi:predicted CoA-substrate-specific enzyme activase
MSTPDPVAAISIEPAVDPTADPLYLGIDIGSLSCDAVLIDRDGRIRGSAVVPTGARNQVAIERARREAEHRAGAGPGQVAAIVATGYGRDRVDGRLASVTEITCHARGITELLPGTEVLIDIGGQDSKAIRMDPAGQVLDFAMNDKCAAGTGRFLEAMARALEVELDQLAELDTANGTSEDSLVLSSMCTVFAESEVVSLIADGTETSRIAGALHRAIATRTQALVKRIAPRPAGLSLAMSGGVARNRGVVHALEALLGRALAVPQSPDTVGALGAALIARDRATG